LKKELLLTVVMVVIGFTITRFVEFDSAPPGLPTSGEKRSRLSELLGSDPREGFDQASTGRRFRFPQDHGPHPGFRNEWWYLTGNLDGEDGSRFGYELTFFRFALAPATEVAASGWQTRQVFIAHLAVTDAGNEEFRVAQRFSRAAAGLAGAQTGPFRVWIDDWSVSEIDAGGENSEERWLLAAQEDSFSLQLVLSAAKSPVLNGKDGLSRKSAAAGNASYYYSISRLDTAGSLRLDGKEHAVSGLSWLDREWSSSALASDQQGWDWFALQLSDGSDLMFYNIRKRDGSQDPHSAGTWISADGTARYLPRGDLTLTVRDHWQSPQGGIYPALWDIRIPALDLSVTVTPLLADQELFTTVRYWEGAVDVTGRRGGAPVEGRGYVELTGYAH
jgi:predicted secreted hydrolase